MIVVSFGTSLTAVGIMESMDYNNYFAPAPHSFGYLGFGNDANLLGTGANGDNNNGAVQVSSSRNLRALSLRPTQARLLILAPF